MKFGSTWVQYLLLSLFHNKKKKKMQHGAACVVCLLFTLLQSSGFVAANISIQDTSNVFSLAYLGKVDTMAQYIFFQISDCLCV